MTSTQKPRPEAHVYEQEFITVERAKKELKHFNNSNRNIDKDTVRRYADLMQKGLWGYVAFSGIAYDKDSGQIVQGQHTLESVIASGEGQWIDVCRNSSFEEQEYMDVGKARKLNGHFVIQQKRGQISKALDASFLGSMTKNLVCFKKKPKGNWGPLPTPPFVECEDFARENMDRLIACYEQSLRLDNKIKGLKTSSKGVTQPQKLFSQQTYALVIYFLVYEFEVISMQKARGLLENFAAGCGWEPRDPMHVLREWSIQHPYANVTIPPDKTRNYFDVNRILCAVKAQLDGEKWDNCCTPKDKRLTPMTYMDNL